MPERKRVAEFVAVVVSGDHVRAIADFYTDDASMQENTKEPRRGREVLVQHEAAALARLARMHTHEPRVVMVDGDRVAINWTFDMTDKEGVTRRWDELALQRWRGDKIAEERFFYDPSSIKAVEP